MSEVDSFLRECWLDYNRSAVQRRGIETTIITAFVNYQNSAGSCSLLRNRTVLFPRIAQGQNI